MAPVRTPGACRHGPQNGILVVGIGAGSYRTRRLSAGRPRALAPAVKKGQCDAGATA